LENDADREGQERNSTKSATTAKKIASLTTCRAIQAKNLSMPLSMEESSSDLRFTVLMPGPFLSPGARSGRLPDGCLK